MNIFTLLFILALMTCPSQANNLDGLPADISQVDRTKLNLDLYAVEESMKDSGSDNINLQEYIRQLFLLIWRLPLLDISTLHRYDSDEDKLISGGPYANALECKRKLMYLSDRLNIEHSNGSASMMGLSTDYRLFNLLDSYGRPSSSFLRGEIVWLGDYDQCLGAKYNYGNNTQTSTITESRYCLAHVRWPNWKRTEGFKEWKYTTIKSAICLPIECDSIAAEQDNNREIIKHLMDVQYGSAYKDFQVGDIYCLPDKEATLTQWWHDTPAICCVLFFALWLSMITLGTVLDFLFGSREHGSSFVDTFSVIRNTSKLFDTSEAKVQNASVQKQQYPILAIYKADEANKNKTVDLKYMHCIKVVTIFIIMRTHFFISTSQIGRIYDATISYDSFDKYHLAFAAMAVNVFFVITGTLTAYLLFKKFPISQVSMERRTKEPAKNLSKHTLLKPSFWVVFCINRYLRIMPLIVILTLVMKYLSKYLGQGPFWDYGTSIGTNGHTCRQSSWLNTLFGLMNFKLVYELCIPASWYVAIDLQCAIVVTPILIMAYLKVPRLTFFVSIVFLWFLYGLQFFMTDTFIPDIIRRFTKYQPNKLASFAIFFHEQAWLYTATFPRAIYYSMGITTGYMLHHYETSGPYLKNSTMQHLFCPLIEILRGPILSNWLTIAVLFSILFVPAWSLAYIPESYMILFSNIHALHVCIFVIGIMYSFLVPMIIIQLSTGSLGNSSTVRRFLNWPGWLPLSRINLSFLLLDTIIVLIYLLRRQRAMILDLDTRIITMIALSVIAYLGSFLTYIMFEAPLRSCVVILEKKIFQLYGTTKVNISSPTNEESPGSEMTHQARKYVITNQSNK